MSDWPALRYEEWKETCETLHRWTQIAGKIRLALTPKTNEWWNVPLYVGARGLTTLAMPYGARALELRFDFVEHALVIETSEGTRAAVPLAPQPVAEFYRRVFARLDELAIDVRIYATPNEVADATPLDEDVAHRSYDREAAARFFAVTRRMAGVFAKFRARFRGKCSPVHFFWGSFDLAVTRFSGRRAPPRPGADAITRDAYDEECSSLGFWPGGAGSDAVVYAYTIPEPPGYARARVLPRGAFYSDTFKEFVLPYERLRAHADPEAALLAFAESTYLQGATLAGWDVDDLRYDRAEAASGSLDFLDGAREP